MSSGARITLTSPDPSSIDTQTQTYEHTHTVFSETNAVTFNPHAIINESKTRVEATIDTVDIDSTDDDSAVDVDYDENDDDDELSETSEMSKEMNPNTSNEINDTIKDEL